MDSRGLGPIIRLMEWNALRAQQELQEAIGTLQTVVGDGVRLQDQLVAAASALTQSGSMTEGLSIERYQLRSQLVDSYIAAMLNNRTKVERLSVVADSARSVTMEARRRLDVIRQVSDERRQTATTERLKRTELESSDVWLSRWKSLA